MIDISAYTETLDGKPVAVFGLGKSCLAVVHALKKAGVDVTAWDDREAARKEGQKVGARIKPVHEHSLEGYGALVLAPGIPLTHPEPHEVVKRAQDAGVEILSDIEILHRTHHGRRTIGITGTNGKSTTTSLIGHILKEAGMDVVIGGNIGHAALDLDMPNEDGVFVLELSSFQLDLCPTFSPDIGVLLNITPDHLDRHGDMKGYAAAKAQIFRGAGTAVIGMDDDPSRGVCKDVEKAEERAVIPISIQKTLDHGVFVDDGILFDASAGEAIELGSIDKIQKLFGVHNMQNAAVAYAACKSADVEPEVIYEALQTYPGLVHRQYPVRIINGVAYVNDSKATNAAAAVKALACHSNIQWIVGGRAKSGGLDGAEIYIDRVKKAYLIGEAAEDFAIWMERYDIVYEVSGTMEQAVASAHGAAQNARGEPGGAGCVLLSPACASFDQYDSFEARGDHFTQLVSDIDTEQAA